MRDKGGDNIEVKLEPNPVLSGNNFFCELVAQKTTKAETFLYDMYGREFRRMQIQLHVGQNRIPMTSPARKGIYVLTLKSGNAIVATKKLIIY
jgi:hypothetical protein